MAGGRWGTAGAYARNSPPGTPWTGAGAANRSMEPTIFLDSPGAEGAGPWRAYSVSYWHNELAEMGFARFTEAVNTTVEQSTAYTSLVSCGAGCAVLFYDLTEGGVDVFKCQPPACRKYAFAMRMHVVAD